MYVCMCMCICICLCICTCICTCTQHVHVHVHVHVYVYVYVYVGGCQNYGPILGTLSNRCRIITGTQKGTIILTTTHVYVYVYVYVRHIHIHTVVSCSQEAIDKQGSKLAKTICFEGLSCKPQSECHLGPGGLAGPPPRGRRHEHKREETKETETERDRTRPKAARLSSILQVMGRFLLWPSASLWARAESVSSRLRQLGAFRLSPCEALHFATKWLLAR